MLSSILVLSSIFNISFFHLLTASATQPKPKRSLTNTSPMASINFNPFENWFKKPTNPLPLLNLHSVTEPFSFPTKKPANFASLSSSSFSSSSTSPVDAKNPEKDQPEKPEEEQPGYYTQMLEQYFWECENLPDYRHTPEVEKILNEDPIFEKKENPTEEEIKENDEWWKQFRASPIVKFLTRAEEIADQINEMELKKNDTPYRKEDRKLWRALPHVIGLDGRPMPRKAIKTKEESDDIFWDFMKQFLFGLWGFRQRPYPEGKPLDVAQAIGYKKLETRYYDFIMRSGGWYYKDRLGRTRGPLELITLKTAWGAGIIDRDTFIWGEDMDEWAPIHMIYGMEKAIATWEVRLGAAATAFLHKLQKGIPPWVPLKGRERKTYKQLQEEALESRRRDQAVLEANDGVWPGVRIPSHALFLWASGSQLTSMLEADHMPNKFIPKDLRRQLCKVIPGLRPWEVLSVEQAMDQITYGGEWYRDPLGAYSAGPDYLEEWNDDVLETFEVLYDLSELVYKRMQEKVPGFDTIMEKVRVDTEARKARRKQRREELRKEKYGRPYSNP